MLLRSGLLTRRWCMVQGYRSLVQLEDDWQASSALAVKELSCGVVQQNSQSTANELSRTAINQHRYKLLP